MHFKYNFCNILTSVDMGKVFPLAFLLPCTDGQHIEFDDCLLILGLLIADDVLVSKSLIVSLNLFQLTLSDRADVFVLSFSLHSCESFNVPFIEDDGDVCTLVFFGVIDSIYDLAASGAIILDNIYSNKNLTYILSTCTLLAVSLMNFEHNYSFRYN